MTKRTLPWLAALALLSNLAHAAPVITHAMALHGEPRYPAGFRHFDYVNPQAPKGGDIRMDSIGTFDSLNPFIPKGNVAEGIGRIYETLAAKSDDEAFSLYGLIAEKFERDPQDNSWIIFHINPLAQFSDGTPITAADVVFSFNILNKEGDPGYKAMFADVGKAEELDPRRARFTFKTRQNRELALILASQLPILPRHFWAKRDFGKTSLEAPLGSGPYTIGKIDAGRSITYVRNPKWWGLALPPNVGSHNFNSITYRYYRDMTVALEAFKSGQYDIREENKAKNWATEYNFPARREGLVRQDNIPNENPAGMQGFVFNLRKPKFQDIRVREALAQAFDFEWSNRFLFFNAYNRTTSFFANSELSSRHAAPSPAELALLAPYRQQLPDTVLSGTTIPVSDGSGRNRKNLMYAQQLLRQAGWRIQNSTLVNAKGEPFEFEILLVQPELERIVQPVRRNLEKLGITMRIRNIDTSQYINRIRKFDYDMIIHSYRQSLSPGNEQRDMWNSQMADQPGSRNIAGIKNPVVDALVEHVITAQSREQLIAATRALDRVLLAHWYVIPQYHINKYRVAYWDFFRRPAVSPKYSLGVDTWWVDQARLQTIRKRQSGGAG